MKKNKKKNFFINILFLLFLILSIDGITYSATKVNKNAVATTKLVVPIINGTTIKLSSNEETARVPHGHAVKGAVYNDDWNEHYRVIAAEEGGENGNGGNYDEAGGVLRGDGGNNLKGAGISAEKALSADGGWKIVVNGRENNTELKEVDKK